MVCMYSIRALIDNSETLLKHFDFFIVPITNPDGYLHAWTSDRMWRKNRSSPPSGSDCYGIDLNRNYDVVGFGIGASSYPCSDNYMGEGAATQPEVIAASNVVLRVKPQVSISLHSYGKWNIHV